MWTHKYIREYYQGLYAKPDDVCPYACSDLGRRCAWLGGQYDSKKFGSPGS